MISTDTVLCDPNALFAAMRDLPHLDLERPAHPDWRLGRAVPEGRPYPVLTSRNGRHLDVTWLPIIGLSSLQDAKSAEAMSRAVIPISGIRLKHESEVLGRVYADLKPEDPSMPFLIAAEIVVTADQSEPLCARPAFTEPVQGRSTWISHEPWVIEVSQMAQWLFPSSNQVEPQTANPKLLERHVPAHMR